MEERDRLAARLHLYERPEPKSDLTSRFNTFDPVVIPRILKTSCPGDWVIPDVKVNLGSHAAPSKENDMSEWKPIETAPRGGKRFWAYDPNRDKDNQQFICWWQDDFSNWSGWMDSFDAEPEPSHWMPLPAPPQEQE